MDAVIAGDGGQPEVGDDEPLSGDFLPVFLLDAIDLGGDDIGAGRDIAQHIGNRNRRGRQHIGGTLGEVNLTLPGLFAVGIGDVLGRVAVEGALEDAVADGGGDRAVADAIDHHVGGLGIDRGDRQAATQPGGQHVGVVGKADKGRAIRHINIERHVIPERLAIGRGQAGAHADVIAAAVFDAGDADLTVFGFDRHLRRVIDDDVAGKVGGAGRQRIGEHGADARRRRFGIDSVGGDAEAMLGDDPVEAGLKRRVSDQRHAGAVGGDRLPPHLAQLEPMGERGEGRRAFGDLFGLQIGVQRCIGGGGGEIVDAATAVGLGGFGIAADQRGIGELHPQRRVIVDDGEGLPVGDHGTGGVFICRGRITGGDQIGIGNLGRWRISVGQPDGEIAGRVDEVLRRKRQLGLARCRQHIGGGRQADLA